MTSPFRPTASSTAGQSTGRVGGAAVVDDDGTALCSDEPPLLQALVTRAAAARTWASRMRRISSMGVSIAFQGDETAVSKNEVGMTLTPMKRSMFARPKDHLIPGPPTTKASVQPRFQILWACGDPAEVGVPPLPPPPEPFDASHRLMAEPATSRCRPAGRRTRRPPPRRPHERTAGMAGRRG